MSRSKDMSPWQHEVLRKLVRALMYEYGDQVRLEAALKNRGFDKPKQQALSRILQGIQSTGLGTAANVARFLGKGWDYFFTDETAPVVHGELPGWEEAESNALIPREIPTDVALYLARTLPVSNRNLNVTPGVVSEMAIRLYRTYPEEGRERAATQMVKEEMERKSSSAKKPSKSEGRIRTK